MQLRGSCNDSHAGSWYFSNPATLSAELDKYLERVPDAIDGVGLPVPRARVIIAPHAGYDYSGACAAWAYKSLDLSAARRVFILGPSHTYYLLGCALTTYARYQTPFGDLHVDEDVINELWGTGEFSKIPRANDVEEHSLEMHLPYLWKRLEQTRHGDMGQLPTIVPILIGSNDGLEEKLFGDILVPYLKDPANAFIVSSDFCHWGTRFSYTKYYSLAAARRQVEERKRYLELRRLEAEKNKKVQGLLEEGQSKKGPNEKAAADTGADVGGVGKEEGSNVVAEEEEDDKQDGTELEPLLVSHKKVPRGEGDMALHESIKILDEQAMAAVETGLHDNFVDNLKETGNTVCGRHPIGVMMAAMEALNKWRDPGAPEVRFKCVQYDRSNKVFTGNESSVSYASFYAVVGEVSAEEESVAGEE